MKPIEIERIEAIPQTRLCLKHAEAIRKHGGEFILTTTHDKTSKQGSLKKNFGGVTGRLRRNQKGIERLKDEHDAEKWQEREKEKC
jgi:hypothetical protein